MPGTKQKNQIVLFYANRIFEDVVLALDHSFRSRNMDVAIVNTLDPKDARLHIVFDANSLPPTAILPLNYIVYQLEQLSAKDNRWLTPEYLQILKRAKYVWEYSHSNIPILRANGVNKVIYMPIAYSPTFRHSDCSSIPDSSKDIDVLFFGGRNPRRDLVIERLRARGVNAVFYDGGLWGEERSAMIRRSRIVLNIHYYGADAILETVRLAVLLANRVFVVSEPGSCPTLQKEYKAAMVFAPYDELVETCIRWLSPDMAAKRRAVANTGFSIFSSQRWSLHGGFYQLCDASTQKENTGSSGSSSGTVLAPVGSHQRIERIPVNTDARGAQTLIIPDFPDGRIPKVSIVTITRNRKEFMGNVVHQVERQDYPHAHLEWILLDSSDREEDIEEIRQTTVPFMRRAGIRFRLEYVSPKTAGYSVSMMRNRAIEMATGEYISFMDDDDYYMDNRVSTAVRFLANRPDKSCVATLELPVYNMMNESSIIMSNTYAPEASMTFRRSLWEERGFEENVMGEGVPFLNERRHLVLDMPYHYNMIALTHGSNLTGRTRLYNGSKSKTTGNDKKDGVLTSLFDMMDDQSQDFYSSLATYLRTKREEAK